MWIVLFHHRSIEYSVENRVTRSYNIFRFLEVVHIMQKVGKKLLELDFFLGLVILGLSSIGAYFPYANCLSQVKAEIKDCRVAATSKVSISGIENMFEMCEMSDVHTWCT